jgi:transcriptional regulator with XRE-family HTH domain
VAKVSDLALDEADELYAAVGFRVTRIRKARGVRQEGLAKAIGITRSSIANLETGRQRMPLHLLLAIAQALGVELADVIDTGRPMPQLAERLPDGPRETVADTLREIGKTRVALARLSDALAPLAEPGESS